MSNIETNYPHTSYDWLEYMANNGVSDRPFDEDFTDLLDPEGYPDPLDTKPERAALASVFCVRAYQRAKKVILANLELTKPSFADITNFVASQTERLQVLQLKNKHINSSFASTMLEAIEEDEEHLRTLPDDAPAASAYHRLENILDVGGESYREKILAPGTQDRFRDSSLIVLYIYAGVAAFPRAMDNLLYLGVSEHKLQKRNLPDLGNLLRVMRASFDSFTVPMASLHKADGDKLKQLEQGGLKVAVLDKDRIRFTDEALAVVRTSEKVGRSRTTRCPFLAHTKDMGRYLDEPVDFTNPLRDAFDLQMGLLAA